MTTKAELEKEVARLKKKLEQTEDDKNQAVITINTLRQGLNEVSLKVQGHRLPNYVNDKDIIQLNKAVTEHVKKSKDHDDMAKVLGYMQHINDAQSDLIKHLTGNEIKDQPRFWSGIDGMPGTIPRPYK